MKKTLYEVGEWTAKDCILSLGCGAAWWEIKQTIEQEAGELLLLDRNKDVLNWPDLDEAIAYFEEQYGKKATTPATIFHADAAQIPLSDETADQIWLLNSLHELDDLKAVLAEIDRVLKTDGCVIVEEILTGGVHEGCGKRLFTRSEIVDLFASHDLHVVYEGSKDEEADYIKFGR
jgi:ubiquinone/menaquinone biosynthesis C-methylase UbiE